MLYGRERDCGQPVRVGHCVRERRRRRWHDRRPSDPLHRRPDVSPIQLGVWPTYYYYYCDYYVVIARRVCDSPPVTAPTPSPEEVPTIIVGTSESVGFENNKKKKRYKDRNHSCCVAGSYRIRLQPRCVYTTWQRCNRSLE